MDKEICGDDADNISDSSSSSSFFLSYDIIYEILSRLCVKALMRFKCVCKQWKLLIEQDKHLIQLHLSQSQKHPRLLINTTYGNWRQGISCFFLSDNSFEDTKTELEFITSHSSRETMLQPINGLICFYYGGSIRIWNMSTREETPWIQTSTKEVEIDGIVSHYLPWYGFGFDPVNKEHKVLCVWDIFRIKGKDFWIEQVCEALTVGDNTWRKINSHGIIPPNYQRGNPHYLSGSIYWLNRYNRKSERPDPMDDVMMVFDVSSEKFRVIQIPDFIVKSAKDPCNFPLGYLRYLLEVNGCIALSSTTRDDKKDPTIKILKFWIAENDEKDMSDSSTNLNWIEDTISMSLEGGEKSLVALHTSTDGDMTIVEPNNPINRINHITVYNFNRKTGIAKKVVFTTNRHHDDGEPCYSNEIGTFIPSILPVKKKKQQQQQLQ